MAAPFKLKDHGITVTEVSCAVYAHHAHTAHEAAVGGIRQAGLRHLQCRGLPGQQSNRGHGFKDIEDDEMVILGTEYACEMKKGVFTLANYLAPKRGILSMH